MINRDWIVELQFDGKKVFEGFKRVDQAYQRTATRQVASEKRKQREIDKAWKQQQRSKEQRSREFDRAERQRFTQRQKEIRQTAAAERKAQAEKNRLSRQEHATAAFSTRKGDMRRRIEAEVNELNRLRSKGAFKGKEQSVSDSIQALNLQKEALAATKTKAAYERLNNSTRDLMVSTSRLRREGKFAERQFNAQRFAANKLTSSLKHAAAGYLSIFTLFQGAGGFYRIGKEMQSMEASLLAASGGVAEAQENMAFLTATSRRLGVSLTAGINGFNKLGIAARSQGYDMQQVRDIYTSVAEASTAFGLSASKQNLVFLATSQIISKGKVSAEELRRQLGDNMPIAIAAMAKSWAKFKGLNWEQDMDNITQKFTKAMEAGKIMSKDVMGDFAANMSEMARGGGALNAAMTKLMSEQGRAVTEMQMNIKDVFADEDVLGLFTSSWKDVKIILQETKPLFKSFGILMGSLFKGVTFVGKTLTPVFRLLGTVINNLVYPFRLFSESIDKVKEANQPLGLFQKMLMGIYKATLYLQLGFYKALIALNDFSTWFEAKETDSGLEKMTKGVASWAAAIFGAVAALKLFGKTARWVVSPFTAIFKKLLGINEQVKKATRTAAKMGGKTAPKAPSGLGSGFKSAKENLKASGKSGWRNVLKGAAKRGLPMSMTFTPEEFAKNYPNEGGGGGFMDFIRKSNADTFRNLDSAGLKKQGTNNNITIHMEVNEAKENLADRLNEALSNYTYGAL